MQLAGFERNNPIRFESYSTFDRSGHRAPHWR
jgi:hypothetical protein